MGLLAARACLLLLGLTSLYSLQAPDFRPELDQLGDRLVDQFSENPLPLDDVARIGALQSLSVAEWLGPMAPIALSPFFGITCLAGLSQYGGDLVPGNAFLSSNPILQNPAVLYTFAVLTLLTSIPRLTKVSKPMAQAIDHLEAYAGIVTIIVIRMFAYSDSGTPEMAMAESTVVQMGFLSFTADTLLSVAAIINIVVINGVKFFFEVLVWLTPFPFIDALLEIGNKSLCAGLMAIYAYSPTLATILNLILFAACLVVWRWTQRRVTWMRSILVDPIRAWLQPSFGIPSESQLVVFPQDALGPFPSKTRLELQPTDSGWQLTQRRFLMSDRSLLLNRNEVELDVKAGIVMNRIELSGTENTSLLFTRRYSRHLADLSQQLGMRHEPKLAARTATA